MWVASSFRRPISSGVRAAAVAFLVVLVVGLPAAITRHPDWQARASLLVLPTATAPPDSAAALYDTLSRGQVPATYAELLRSAGPVEPAVNALRLGPADRTGLAVDVEVVPDTSVIEITATAPRAATAVAVADEVAREGNARIAQLGSPYGSRMLASAAGTEERGPLGARQASAVVLLLAVVAALVTYQLFRQLVVPRRGPSWHSHAAAIDERDIGLFPARRSQGAAALDDLRTSPVHPADG